MGRGREKAKQQRLGRTMKYNTSELDLNALTEELHRGASKENASEDKDANGNELAVKEKR
jgi:hypothetical protein